MDMREAGELLYKRGVEIPMYDERDIIEVGLDLGHFTIK